MKNKVFLIIAVFFIGFSCNRAKDEDYSLMLEQYREMDIPDPNIAWDMDDIQIAQNSLSGIKWDKPFSLPRKDSKKSGILFDRMVTLENMAFLQNDTLMLHEKGYMSLEFLQMLKKWEELYTNPVWERQYYQRELVDININQVRVTHIMVDLTKKIMVSDDPNDIVLQEGVPKIKLKYVASLINALHRQNNTSGFLKADIERMADSLSTSIRRNRDWMDSTAVNKIRKSIHNALDSTSSDYVKKRYLEVAEFL